MCVYIYIYICIPGLVQGPLDVPKSESAVDSAANSFPWFKFRGHWMSPNRKLIGLLVGSKKNKAWRSEKKGIGGCVGLGFCCGLS